MAAIVSEMCFHHCFMLPMAILCIRPLSGVGMNCKDFRHVARFYTQPGESRRQRQRRPRRTSRWLYDKSKPYMKYSKVFSSLIFFLDKFILLLIDVAKQNRFLYLKIMYTQVKKSYVCTKFVEIKIC